MEIGNIERIDMLIDKLQIFDEKLNQFGEQLMESGQFDELLSKMNVDQMKKGIRADDAPIRPDYAESTIRIKKSKGQPTNVVTLRDTGEFQGGIRARSYNGKIELLSEDSKSGELMDKYSDEIFGITDGNLAIARDFLKPQFVYFTRNVLL